MRNIIVFTSFVSLNNYATFRQNFETYIQDIASFYDVSELKNFQIELAVSYNVNSIQQQINQIINNYQNNQEDVNIILCLRKTNFASGKIKLPANVTERYFDISSDFYQYNLEYIYNHKIQDKIKILPIFYVSNTDNPTNLDKGNYPDKHLCKHIVFVSNDTLPNNSLFEYLEFSGLSIETGSGQNIDTTDYPRTMIGIGGLFLASMNLRKRRDWNFNHHRQALRQCANRYIRATKPTGWNKQEGYGKIIATANPNNPFDPETNKIVKFILLEKEKLQHFSLTQHLTNLSGFKQTSNNILIEEKNRNDFFKYKIKWVTLKEFDLFTLQVAEDENFRFIIEEYNTSEKEIDIQFDGIKLFENYSLLKDVKKLYFKITGQKLNTNALESSEIETLDVKRSENFGEAILKNNQNIPVLFNTLEQEDIDSETNNKILKTNSPTETINLTLDYSSNNIENNKLSFIITFKNINDNTITKIQQINQQDITIQTVLTINLHGSDNPNYSNPDIINLKQGCIYETEIETYYQETPNQPKIFISRKRGYIYTFIDKPRFITPTPPNNTEYNILKEVKIKVASDYAEVTDAEQSIIQIEKNNQIVKTYSQSYERKIINNNQTLEMVGNIGFTPENFESTSPPYTDIYEIRARSKRGKILGIRSNPLTIIFKNEYERLANRDDTAFAWNAQKAILKKDIPDAPPFDQDGVPFDHVFELPIDGKGFKSNIPNETPILLQDNKMKLEKYRYSANPPLPPPNSPNETHIFKVLDIDINQPSLYFTGLKSLWQFNQRNVGSILYGETPSNNSNSLKFGGTNGRYLLILLVKIPKTVTTPSSGSTSIVTNFISLENTQSNYFMSVVHYFAKYNNGESYCELGVAEFYNGERWNLKVLAGGTIYSTGILQTPIAENQYAIVYMLFTTGPAQNSPLVFEIDKIAFSERKTSIHFPISLPVGFILNISPSEIDTDQKIDQTINSKVDYFNLLGEYINLPKIITIRPSLQFQT